MFKTIPKIRVPVLYDDDAARPPRVIQQASSKAWMRLVQFRGDVKAAIESAYQGTRLRHMLALVNEALYTERGNMHKDIGEAIIFMMAIERDYEEGVKTLGGSAAPGDVITWVTKDPHITPSVYRHEIVSITSKGIEVADGRIRDWEGVLCIERKAAKLPQRPQGVLTGILASVVQR